MTKSFFALFSAFVLIACSSDDPSSGSSNGGSGSAANGGSGGSANNGGSAGQSGSAGAAAGSGSSGSSGASGSSGSSGGANSCVIDSVTHMGDGTYYDADGSGNCSFDPSPNDLMVGAMNHDDYLASAVCGACVSLTGPNGTIKIRIVDQCPECLPGDIDLSPQAFEQIAPLVDGRVDISWQYVSCDVSGPIAYRFKEGSNEWWTAIQIRNHKYPIASVEGLKDGAYVPLVRQDYNFFVLDSGLGPGPYTLRVTDTLGHSLEDSNIAFAEATTVNGAAQFPDCE